MAGTFGSTAQAGLLRSFLGQGTIFTSKTLWVAMGTSTCWTAAGSDLAGEPAAAGGYARYAIGTNSFFETITVAAVAPTSGAVATNTATLTISAGTTSNWGTNTGIGWIMVMDTSTVGAGNILGWCTAAAKRDVLTGDQVLIAAGSLTIQLGP